MNWLTNAIKFGEKIHPSSLADNVEKEIANIQNYVEYSLGKPPSIL